MLGRAAAQLVRLYQVSLGRILPGRCRYHPTCSSYAMQALRTNGLFYGGVQTIWRLLRCAPWGRGGDDPVRARRKVGEAIDA